MNQLKMKRPGKSTLVFWTMLSVFTIWIVPAASLSQTGMRPKEMVSPGPVPQKPAATGIGVLNGSKINIRQGPGLNQKVIGQTAEKGTVVIVEGQAGDWIKVFVNGTTGWIYRTFIDIREPASTPALLEGPPPKTQMPTPKAESGAAPVQPKAAESPARQATVGIAEGPDIRPAGYQRTLQKAVALVFILLNSIEQRQDLGLEEKQRMAMEFIRNVRWGPANRNYFWINDVQGNMILEPLFPQTEGNNYLTAKDRNNKKLFADYIQIGLEDGEGFVDHHGLGYDGNRSNPRISIVRLFKAWNWIVGTGVERELIEAYEEPEGLNLNIPLPEINDEAPASGI